MTKKRPDTAASILLSISCIDKIQSTYNILLLATRYSQLTIFYYWRHIVPLITSLYYSTLELIGECAISLLPGPVISHHLLTYSLIAIKARCVCQTLFQRVIHSRFQQQGDHPCVVSDGPTKRPQHMRICSLINCTYLLFHHRVTNRLLSYPDLRLVR